MDRENFGELSEAKFESALLKVGVQLRPKEKRILKDILDSKNIGFLRYRPLLREIQGVPQGDFLPASVNRLARTLVLSRDLDKAQFKRLIDPDNEEMMSLA
jgi:L-rhamnose isomerase